jgi:hypothetical protein
MDAPPVFVTNFPSNISLSPSTSFGASSYHNLISAWTTNLTLVKNAVWTVTSLHLSNNTSTVKYFKFFNKTSAPVLWTDTPIQVYMIPANSTRELTFWAYGLRFTAGISYAITWGIANADATAIWANEVAVSIAFT